jgi:mono/diheme cytochrome c family protein
MCRRATMTRVESLILSSTLIAACVVSSQAWAQTLGDRTQGRDLARQVCAECHAVGRSPGASPNPGAPPFEVIANLPGMTSIALTAALRTSHREMPNVMLKPDEMSNIIAYILSLKLAN